MKMAQKSPMVHEEGISWHFHIVLLETATRTSRYGDSSSIQLDKVERVNDEVCDLALQSGT